MSHDIETFEVDMVVADTGLVTSRSPKDIPACCGKLVEELPEGRHPVQARSARSRFADSPRGLTFGI